MPCEQEKRLYYALFIAIVKDFTVNKALIKMGVKMTAPAATDTVWNLKKFTISV